MYKIPRVAPQLNMHSTAHVSVAGIIPSICDASRLLWRTSHWNLVEQIRKQCSCLVEQNLMCQLYRHLNLLDLMVPAASRNEATPTVAEPSAQTPLRAQWALSLSKGCGERKLRRYDCYCNSCYW